MTRSLGGPNIISVLMPFKYNIISPGCPVKNIISLRIEDPCVMVVNRRILWGYKMEKKIIALVAHDRKKTDIVMWANFNRGKLSRCRLVGTGNTAKLIKEKTGMEVEEMLSGPQGGDAQIAARVAEGSVDAVIFLRDPLGKHPHDPDINMLMRVCDVHNVPLATNLAAADLIITAFTVE